MGAAEWEVAMTDHQIPEVEDRFEPFAEMLAVMEFEELIRFRYRLGKRGCARTVGLLTLEIARREE
jgi:hypothetical protein